MSLDGKGLARLVHALRDSPSQWTRGVCIGVAKSSDDKAFPLLGRIPYPEISAQCIQGQMSPGLGIDGSGGVAPLGGEVDRTGREFAALRGAAGSGRVPAPAGRTNQ